MSRGLEPICLVSLDKQGAVWVSSLPVNEPCCQHQNFERHPDPEIADIGHGEGVEYTIGKCASCGVPLISCWVGGGMAHGLMVVSRERIDTFLDAPAGILRRQLLSEWFNEL